MSSIAIIGTGIAGMGAAHLLHSKYNLTIFEKNNYAGGHTNTIFLEDDSNKIPIDTGFIVFNFKTYPNLTKLFTELGIELSKTDMSFSVQHTPSGLEYGTSNINGLFAQRKNIINPKYIHFLLEINKFNNNCIEVFDNEDYFNQSIKNYIEENSYSKGFLYKYLMPLTSTLWSVPTDESLNMPISTMVRFLKNQGFLGVNNQLQWHRIKNGSSQYRDKLIAPFKQSIQLNNRVVKVKRILGRPIVICQDGSETEFDKIVFACHANEALQLLEDPTDLESSLLRNFNYQKNSVTLHSDESVMPKNKLAWAAWNHRIDHFDANLTLVVFII